MVSHEEGPVSNHRFSKIRLFPRPRARTKILVISPRLEYARFSQEEDRERLAS